MSKSVCHALRFKINRKHDTCMAVSVYCFPELNKFTVVGKTELHGHFLYLQYFT